MKDATTPLYHTLYSQHLNSEIADIRNWSPMTGRFILDDGLPHHPRIQVRTGLDDHAVLVKTTAPRIAIVELESWISLAMFIVSKADMAAHR